MNPPRTRKRLTIRNSLFALAAVLFLLAILGAVLWSSWPGPPSGPYRYVRTVAGLQREFGEPFGIAVKGGEIYVSDGQYGKIWRLSEGRMAVFAEGLDTPSAIAFDGKGNLIVADSGSHSIKSISPKGEIKLLAGVDGRPGFSDGESASALFRAPIGVAVAADGKVIVADTYNDRIRVIADGRVSTIVGGGRGFSDGLGEATKFDTPSGVALWRDKILVADTGNNRIRVVESDGRAWTLAGNGQDASNDGLLASASFVQPTALAVSDNDAIFVSDGNALRQIGGNAMPAVQTISDERRGLRDGNSTRARFNRSSGLAIDGDGELVVADSENRLVRRFSRQSDGHEITADEILSLRDKPEEFRTAQPPRWPFDPPHAKRDIAGTLGEIRGEMTSENDQVWFHNGLDIAGRYGETARFVRDEKVLRPIAAENFGTLREFVRMPTLGYVHIRLGRNAESVPFADERFLFDSDGVGKLTGVRIPRGAKFRAGEAIGTLNAMNHVHVVAGRNGSEMNALDALALPNLTDSRPPVIEKVTFYDQNWNPVETVLQDSRIKIRGKTRLVVRAYDQVDGNSERRRLGVYKLGYQVLKMDRTPVADTKWTILFDRMPSNAAVALAYANESRSGATGETIFNYIVTNVVDGEEFREDFLDPAILGKGDFILRVVAADYFGNVSSRDVNISIE